VQIVTILEWIGIVGLLTMLLFVAIHVIRSNIFLLPLKGATELISFTQIIVISCAMAANFFVGRHISIEFVFDNLPALLRKLVDKIISIIMFLFFSVFAWRSFLYGSSLYRAGEVSSSARIPLFPFAYVITIGSLIAALYYLIVIFKREENSLHVAETIQKEG